MMRATRLIKGLTHIACGALLLPALLCLPAEAQSWWRFGRGGRSDLHCYAGQSGGLEPGAPVVWRGLTVGEVSGVKAEGGRVRIDAVLAREYRHALPGGLRARPWRRGLDRTPVLLLVSRAGAGDASFAVGREVPLATWIEAVDLRHAGVVVVGIVVLLLVLALLRGLLRLLLILMVAGALMGGFLWLRERGVLSGTIQPAGDGLGDDAAELIERLRSASAHETAERVQRLLTEAAARIQAEGPEAVARVRDRLGRDLRTESRRLEADGDAESAGIVERLSALVTRDDNGNP